MRRFLPYIFALFFVLLFSLEGTAQCAMCKAISESSSQADPTQLNTAAGLNKGILYIMFIPYVLLGFLFWYFFRKKIRAFFEDMGLIAIKG
ncbi:MAG: hypothetical protein ACPF8V_08255 [Luteibaculum sp.]